jgi:hypothetical protein
MDIRLYKNTGEYSTEYPASEQTASAALDTASATGLEVTANKVVKFLNTTYGTDALEPTYGSRALTLTQISKNYLPRFRFELEKDIERCLEYIKRAENHSAFTGDKLSKITIREIQYNDLSSPDKLNVFLIITTVSQNTAIVSIPIDIG